MNIKELNDKLQKNMLFTEYSDRKIVFGEGKTHSPSVMLIGEAPGGSEEKEGRPFVGSAGKNLNEFLEALELFREEIYITNVVKIRPFKLSPKTGSPVNRTPDKKEIGFFCPYLLEEIEIIKPEIIVTLGNTPLNALMGKEYLIGAYHGRLIKGNGGNIFPLYHPAAIIYNRSLKETYFEDLKALKALL